MPIEGDSPLTINFTDTSTEQPTSWNWSFAGGTPATSNAQNPTVTFNTEGAHTVILTASNALGGTGTTKEDIVTVLSETPTTFTLTIQATTEGDGSASGGGEYPEGTFVSISAVPDYGAAFISWTGQTGTIINTTAANTEIVMNSNLVIKAEFTWGM